MKKLLTGLLIMLMVGSFNAGFISATNNTAKIEIPISTVIFDKPYSTHTLKTVPVDPDMRGYVCSASAIGKNQGSVHPGNNLIVATGSDSITLEDVERAPGAITNASGTVTLGNNVVITLNMGNEGVFSAGMTVELKCRPEVEPPEFTAYIACKVVDDKAVYTLVIEQKNDTPATYDPANGTVMPNGDPVKVTATYTDASQQSKTVSETAEASEDCTPPVDPPEFTAHIICTFIEGEAIYKLVIEQTAGTDAVYSPANGTILENGEEIAVTATYLDEGEQSQTISAKATASEDCTPPIEVCRDGAVISIHPDERLDSDTELPCPEIIPPAEVLPVTGIGGMIAGMLGLTGVGTGIGSWFKSRKALRSGMLS